MRTRNAALKRAVKATGMKQYAICERLKDSGLTEWRLSRILNDAIEPTEDEKKALAIFLGQPVAELFPSVAA
jgi:transcriptional regulator with XRE-family HTH domain